MMGNLNRFSDLDDMELGLADAVRLRWYRAVILAFFYNPIKVRTYAEKIEEMLDEAYPEEREKGEED